MSYVYIAQFSGINDKFKVGISANPTRRFRQLKRDFGEVKEATRVIYVPNTYRQLEKMIHAQFKKDHVDILGNGGTEFFDENCIENVLTFVSSIINMDNEAKMFTLQEFWDYEEKIRNRRKVMALNLSKSATALNLTKSAKHLLEGLMFGISWDGDSDLDAAAVVLKNGKPLGGGLETALVGYPMMEKQADGSFKYLWTVKGADYSGDARDGNAVGFDETINFKLNEIEGDEIVLFLTSYSDKDPISFGATISPKAVLCDQTGKELADIKLDEDAAFGTAFKMVRIFLDNGNWKVENVNEQIGCSANGMEDVVALYQ